MSKIFKSNSPFILACLSILSKSGILSFVKAKKRTSIQLMGKKFNLKLNEYREIFPASKLPSGKPARVNVRTLENSFRWFFETYDFTWDEIINATRMYVNEYRDKQYMYMKTSQYFIAIGICVR